MEKLKLLVVLENNFNDIELNSTLSVLLASGQVERYDYFIPKNNVATGQFGVVNIISHKKDINLNDYNAIFIPGGRGAQELRQDTETLNLIKSFYDADKYVFAICDAPNTLMEAKVVPNAVVYSSYPSQWSIPTRGLNRSKELTSVNRKYITGKNALAATDLGFRIIKELYGQDKMVELYNKINGLESH
ncbi:DJ-1/PfpI family protein [Mycoplasmopsis verecunda]|uniref:4-methyl-5(B-hydroxyethyl)-thiazole monophosphate biosynthesis n=1 Tax=Mycoplasmopsis verecunda TaxID=171291 RepID=A0A1T4LTX3_9BACT|nr:DJ-1/PfpI family protein [Mycoplasmopsis verecunda]WPB54559.1 DJ-1/PfpI family protein [Mycoplasmopsis verecunda]SJZ58066.1 4-methyl-5(b-hydroxyethyl)-thiazole monophosphate biosynthesis [Mycoplasmopsis verecunda]